MVSLDSESLLTNIPLNEVIDICIDDLLCRTNRIPNLHHNDIRELLTLAGYESFFIYSRFSRTGNLTVLQWVPHWVQFLPMLFLCNFEKQWFSKCASDILPQVFKRY